MATRFVNIDRDTALLLPPDPAERDEWVPADHLVHFILDAVEAIDVSQVKVNTRGTGDEQYPPSMLLALLVYRYATGVFGSRRIEQSTYPAERDGGACAHGGHASGSRHSAGQQNTFRRENNALFTESFVKVLQLAQELKLARFGQISVSVDGTKIAANASKHSAVSYAHAGKSIEQLELEVKELLAKAEQADATPLQEGLTVPEAITRRQQRKAALEKARAAIEARAPARYAADLAEHEKKMDQRQARREHGEKVSGREPRPPSPEPKPKEQYNFTDPESRIMKTADGFQQCYNAQAAVEVQSRLIVGERVSQAPNDKEELVPTVAAIAPEAGPIAAVLADSGFYSEAAVTHIEQKPDGSPTGTTVYTAIARTGHHRSVADLEKKAEPAEPPPSASIGEKMRHRLETTAGKTLYKQRQSR